MFKKNKTKLKTFLPTGAFMFLLVLPSSTNYQLKDYSFGSGGASNATSTNYSMTAISGEQSGLGLSSSNYKLGSGLIFANQANVPGAPTFTNPGNYYNKLQIILNISSNPSDTKFAIAISTDNFVTTNFVQSDQTVGVTLGSEDYQTYASWGGASGTTIIGLTAGTTYQVKVKAMQGRATETGWGPTASASTVNPTLSFNIRTDTQSNSPFSVDFGTMNTGSVNVATNKIQVTFATNGQNGGKVYITGANAGLYSAGTGYKINAVAGDLSALGEGFGLQGVSATQTSGGPFALSTPFAQPGDTVGTVDTTVREIFSASAPLVGGSGSFQLKARPSTTANPASDYAETLTVIAAGSF